MIYIYEYGIRNNIYIFTKNFGTNNKSRLEQMRNNKYVTLNIREQRLKEN